ncbi:MAG: DUF2225 domain-containing protein [Planctomycetes bacterium]|nr:DUF2225 domain-containing protein [Planctomycetota bacterium]
MATPVTVKLSCPLCATVFQARTMGSSYYIAGVDTDLRELGSIEEVRRFAVATCPRCRFTDYSWNYLGPEELTAEERRKLQGVLKFDPKGPRRPAAAAPIDDFERFRLAALCFQARGMDASTLAELALMACYVARDLGRRDLEPLLRDEAAALFFRALEEEDLPAPLRLRYAYLAGELSRRAGRREAAEAAFERAVEASIEAAGEDDDDLEATAVDVGRLARRMLAVVRHRDAPAATLLELTREDDADVAAQARVLLARRRDRQSVDATRQAWEEAPAADRSAMLAELVTDPPAALFDLFVEALDGPVPDDIRLAARALGALGDPRGAGALVAALERGVLSTETALVEALRRLDAPRKTSALIALLGRWEAEGQPTGDPEEDAWRFTSDPTPLKSLLYTSDDPFGLELLIRDMRALRENDLWDKVPSGGPVSAALTLNGKVTLALRGLVSSSNAATRRWAAYCLAEMDEAGARDEIRGLVRDDDRVVRLQAASALARLGDRSHEGVVLRELRALGEDDVPFALHFLVPFQSPAVKAFLLELLERGAATPGEVLPLLGRQAPDDRLRGLLLQGLLDTNDDTRAGAVTGLAFQGGADVPQRLRLLYDAEDSDEVQRRIVFGLGSLAQRGIEREETVRFLRERLPRGNPRVRFAIALALLNLDDPTGIDIVRERAALFDESFDRYDLVAPALRTLQRWDERRRQLQPPAAAAR